MGAESTDVYRFGDLLALARQSWIRQMSAELGRRGFPDYRSADAATMRLLLHGPVPVGHLGAVLGVTRQAARKVARQLEQRGYVRTVADVGDRRKVNVALTDAGSEYAAAVVEVVASLNRALGDRIAPAALAAADGVLRAVLQEDEELARFAARLPAPHERHGD